MKGTGCDEKDMICFYHAVFGVDGAAFEVNERTENIGARRLHTVLEKLLEDISYSAADLALQQADQPLTLTDKDVEQCLGTLVKNDDLSRFIL